MLGAKPALTTEVGPIWLLIDLKAFSCSAFARTNGRRKSVEVCAGRPKGRVEEWKSGRVEAEEDVFGPLSGIISSGREP
jgi:hypothetical protein